MFSSTQSHSFGYFPCHFASHAARSAPGFLQVAPVVQPAQLRQAVVVGLARQVVERVAQEVHVATLPDRLRADTSGSLCLRPS